jgi:hypothetical protein
MEDAGSTWATRRIITDDVEGVVTVFEQESRGCGESARARVAGSSCGQAPWRSGTRRTVALFGV